MLPVAHVGHYLWVFYLLPVVVVVIGIVRTMLGERRDSRADADAAVDQDRDREECDRGS